MDAIGLSELIDRPVSSFSGGQRRRLEIARALVSTPRVLFLDEPTAGLDPRIRHELLDLIAGLRAREEMTILVTTHYLDEAERLCDRVAIIHLGRIVALDSPRALLAGLGDEILEFRVSGDPEAALAELRATGVAGPDAFALGARITIALHHRGAADALAAIDAAPSCGCPGDRHPRSHPRRRLPQPYRRPIRRSQLTQPRTQESDHVFHHHRRTCRHHACPPTARAPGERAADARPAPRDADLAHPTPDRRAAAGARPAGADPRARP